MGANAGAVHGVVIESIGEVGAFDVAGNVGLGALQHAELVIGISSIIADILGCGKLQWYKFDEREPVSPRTPHNEKERTYGHIVEDVDCPLWSEPSNPTENVTLDPGGHALETQALGIAAYRDHVDARYLLKLETKRHGMHAYGKTGMPECPDILVRIDRMRLLKPCGNLPVASEIKLIGVDELQAGGYIDLGH